MKNQIRELFKITIYLLVIFNVSSCGFQVIYKENEDGQKSSKHNSYSQELASVRIQKGRTLLSQKLKSSLYDVLNPDYLKEDPKYFLILDIKRQKSSTFITSTGASGRNKLTLTVGYELKNLKNAASISEGKTSVSDNFDVTTNRYGTVEAENYVESNLTKIVAQNIRNSIVNDLIEAKKKCNDKNLEESLTFTCPLTKAKDSLEY